MIFEDILYNNKNFDSNSMCLERFKSIRSNRLLPVCKYVNSATEDISANEKLITYINMHDTKEKLVPSNIKKSLKSLPIIGEYDVLLNELSTIPDINKKAGLLLKNIDSFDIDQIRDICKQLFEYDREASMNSTHFKRCVMYIDLLENSKK